MTEEQQPPPESLLPYEEWHDAAMRQIMVRALSYVAVNGLPGEHHFYLTFRTDHPGVVIPSRLRAQYPQEMTIVLQHQFWDLKADEEAGLISVGLSFGGVPSTLVIPLGAVVAFVDPHGRYGIQFRPRQADVDAAAEAGPTPEAPDAPDRPAADETAPSEQVVSLDAFRRRTPPKT